MTGYGCIECKFAQERERKVEEHMRGIHKITDTAVKPVECRIQLVFSSNLRSYWKIADSSSVEETTDEGLLALRLFSAEVKNLEQEDTRSAVGIPYTCTVELIHSCSS